MTVAQLEQGMTPREFTYWCELYRREAIERERS